MKDRRLETEKTGKVWLVGAGPSDPGLFTLKGQQVLAEAEVVVYDALVGQGVLAMIPEQAEVINAGKRSSRHTLPQEQISRLLAARAAEGKRVVRLKGGDPFLFGRGGEEIELLLQEGIPFEVVPGVTSALSVPAYQGIPVTHRDFCSSLHLITGHKRSGKDYDIDFEALVRTKGTLVFLMGVSSLGDICRGLLKAGMDPDLPAALLICGTTAAQRRIVATVSTLEEEVNRQGSGTPAVIVVGKVCSLAEQFSWYDARPLSGVKVLLTRPKDRIGETAAALRREGAEVLELPAIRTVPVKNNARLRAALAQLDAFRWIVFTSPAGVNCFFAAMKENRLDGRTLAGLRFAVIGQGTARELERHGFFADLIPEVYDARHLGEALRAVCGKGDRLLIPRAAIGSPELLAGLGEDVCAEDIPVYETVYEKSRFVDLQEEFAGGSIDYAIFTSASTVKGFAAAAPEVEYTKVRAVCIGEQTAAAAQTLGMKTYTAKRATIESLVDCLLDAVLAEGKKNVRSAE